MKEKIARWIKFYVAANAITLASLLLIFLLCMLFWGPSKADAVWSTPIYTVVFIISFIICVKYMRLK
jgi:hypothetical protein